MGVDGIGSGGRPVPGVGGGELDAARSVEAEATTGAEGALSPVQLDFVREALRDQLAADPVLIELVRRATGSAPPTRAG